MLIGLFFDISINRLNSNICSRGEKHQLYRINFFFQIGFQNCSVVSQHEPTRPNQADLVGPIHDRAILKVRSVLVSADMGLGRSRSVRAYLN